MMKIVKSLEESSLSIKGFSKTIENKKKEHRCEFVSMFLESLDGRLLGNLLAGNGWKVKIAKYEAIILEQGAGVKKQQQ